MSEILILARVKINELDLPIIADYYFEVKEKLVTVPGFLGLSVWRDPRNGESFLVAYEYADADAADRGLVAISEVRVLAETQLADFRPADVLRVSVFARSRARIAETPQTGCISMSVRIADPGYAPELLEEIGRIFEELNHISGFLGYVYGASDTLDEEIIGVATWANASAFSSSLPRGNLAREIKFFTRFF